MSEPHPAQPSAGPQPSPAQASPSRPAAGHPGRSIGAEGARFLLVGLAGLVVDVGAFNLLRFAGGEGPLYDKPLTAKVLSVVLATLVTYSGNKLWTFRHREHRPVVSGYVLYFVLNAIGMGIAVGCLAISHYVLGLTSPLADNIAANVIGLGLGTAFRFWSYRRWVFPPGTAPLTA